MRKTLSEIEMSSEEILKACILYLEGMEAIVLPKTGTYSASIIIQSFDPNPSPDQIVATLKIKQ